MAVFKKIKSNTQRQIILCIILSFLFSGWLRRILFENTLVGGIFIINTITLVLFFYNFKKASVKLFLITFGLLFFLQLKSTNIKNTYSFTPSEIDQQIQRMNYYPPSQARLAYYLEYKKEPKFFERMVRNFTEVMDFNTYFPNYFSIYSLPFFMIGIFIFIRERLVINTENKDKMIVYCLTFVVFILGVFGVNGKFGPFLIFPYINLFIATAVFQLFEKVGIYGKNTN